MGSDKRFCKSKVWRDFLEGSYSIFPISVAYGLSESTKERLPVIYSVEKALISWIAYTSIKRGADDIEKDISLAKCSTVTWVGIILLANLRVKTPDEPFFKK